MYCLKPLLIFLVASAVVGICRSNDYSVGTNVNAQLVHVERVSMAAIPLKVRTKTVSYHGQQFIKGVTAIDLAKSKSRATIMAGGIGFTYVTMRLKSERGDGLDYNIHVYA